jgi:hypothetical protein
MRTSNEHGIALITTLLIMMLVSALLVGFTIVVSSDQRFRFIDRDRQKAFYGASAGLEKLTADLGNLFFVNLAPTAAQVTALAATAPVIPGVSFLKQDGTTGYTITAATPASAQISTGPYAGLIALTTVYTIDVTARTSSGGEVHLKRDTETVAIPVFQFGMFSDVDLAFYAGSDFNFGGRIHTNGNLFLAAGGGATLFLTDKVTAVKDIIRVQLENGASITASPTHDGNVSVASTNPTRLLDSTEGSGSGCWTWNPTTCVSTAISTWDTLSRSTYNYYLRNGKTGAKQLNLPLLTAGGTNPDLIRRPAAANENTANPLLYGERDYTKASLRILLSDTAAQITNLPGIVGTPLSLEAGQTNTWPGYNPVDTSNHPPIAATAVTATLLPTVGGLTNFTISVLVNGTVNFPSSGPWAVWLNNVAMSCTGKTASTFTTCNRVAGGSTASAIGNSVTNNPLTPQTAVTGLLGGFILIEKQDAASPGVWTDVTPEILKLGITAQNQNGNTGCTPNPNSVVQLQRRAVQTGGAGCPGGAGTQSIAAGDYWAQALFDPREAEVRDNITPPGPLLGGVMYYVSIDAKNLAKWFAGTIGTTGTVAHNSGGAGYSVYFSDRRNNNNGLGAADPSTGEYGWEDIINPASAAGTPNGVVDWGEDVNADGVLQTYGRLFQNNAGFTGPIGGTGNTVPPGPGVQVTALQAQSNRAVLFRRALKMTNGGIVGGVAGVSNGVNNLPPGGLTIISENPVYIQGDWNANQTGWVEPNVATSVLADAVTLLSDNWSDDNSFTNPYNASSRTRPADNYYRVAVLGGKNMPFPLPTVFTPNNADFGTDGGAHNFLRMLEGEVGGGTPQSTVHYMGSIATFFYSRQATGVFKSSGDVYGVPVRDFTFDLDFLDPAKLPPLTPVFRDLNTIGFWQDTRPGK